MRARRSSLTGRPAAVVMAFVALAGSIAVGTGLLPRLPAPAARADDVTASLNNLRTGWDSDEPGLSPATVGGSTFGQLFETHLNGQVYGQPLVVGQMLIVATETNHVYGLNAVTGTVEWSRYLGPAEPWTVSGCADLTPDIGVTSAPVYDPTTGNVYLAAIVNNGPSPSQPHVYAYALDAQTGAIRPGWPVTIEGSPVNDPAEKFNPASERQRAGLLLLGGWLYIGFAAYCDYLPYAGYVAGVDTSTRALTLWTDEAGLTNNQAGIWQGGGGLMSDGPGRIFLATGNGVSPPAGPGDAPPPELGDSVVRLDVAANGTLSAADFFSPANAPTLDADDQDFGAGGPVGLPFGTASDPDLLVQAGKDGRVFLLNRNDLGGREQGPGGGDDAVSQTGPFGGQWGHPAAFGPTATVAATTSDDYVYYVGSGDVMRYLQFGENSAGTPVLTDVADSSTTFGYTSGSPVVTSDGDDPSSAVVWEIYAAGVKGKDGSLEAFAGDPGDDCSSSAPCTMSPIWSAPIGTAAEFSIPATSAGRVYLGTRDGNVFGFGSPDAAPLTGSPLKFSDALMGGKAVSATETMTAASPVTVTAISVSEPQHGSPFTAGSPQVNGSAVKLPVTLAAGDTLKVKATFSPAAPGGVTGALVIHTNAVNFPVVNVSLTGQGVVPGLYGPASDSLGKVPDGLTASKNVIVTNGNTVAEKVTAVARPAAPFAAKLPATGTVLAPGESIAVGVSYRPTTTRASNSSFTITTSGGHRLTVRLSGTGKKAVSSIVAGRAAISFGSVALGSSTTRTIVIKNAGNLPATITQGSGPGVPFGTEVLVPAGTPVNPGYSISIPVTFTPTSAGSLTGHYTLRWTDASGQHRLSVAESGTGVSPASDRQAIAPPGGGWTLNGSATMSGAQLSLTAAGPDQAGTAVYPLPRASNGLTASFTADLAGSGGMTIALLNATTSGSTSAGRDGGQFGFGGLSGVAVVLGAHRYTGDPSGNFVGVGEGSAGKQLHLVASTSDIPAWSAGPQRVLVAVRGRRVLVSVAGKRVLSVLLAKGVIPARVLVGFTGATGYATGARQTVTAAVVRAAGRTLPAPGGGWSFNGSALMAGPAAELTTAGKDEAGSVVYPVAVPTAGLEVTFTAQLYGGSGGEGLTFSLLNPADAVTSVGGDGAGYGVAGVAGSAVTLSTMPAPDGGSQQVFIAGATAGSSSLSIGQRAEILPPLRAEPDVVTVRVEPSDGSYVVTVWLDGEQVLQQYVTTLTSTALLAFTGATGSLSDIHLVRNIAISATR